MRLKSWQRIWLEHAGLFKSFIKCRASLMEWRYEYRQVNSMKIGSLLYSARAYQSPSLHGDIPWSVTGGPIDFEIESSDG
jgi:hypothetical protein